MPLKPETTAIEMFEAELASLKQIAASVNEVAQRIDSLSAFNLKIERTRLGHWLHTAIADLSRASSRTMDIACQIQVEDTTQDVSTA